MMFCIEKSEKKMDGIQGVVSLSFTLRFQLNFLGYLQINSSFRSRKLNLIQYVLKTPQAFDCSISSYGPFFLCKIFGNYDKSQCY